MRRRLKQWIRGRPRHDWTLLFMHIPKTAGSSLRDALGQLYLPEECQYLYDVRGLAGAVHPTEFSGIPEEQRASFQFVAGHFPYGIHEQVPRESRYMTVVRDAVDRVASLYHHYRRIAALRPESRGGSEGRLILESGLSLEDWGFGLQRIEIDNEMVRYISGRREVPFGTCTDDMLQEALDHVEEHFAQVLVVERMDQSMRALESAIGAGLPRLGRQNVNEGRTPLAEMEPKVVARIRELNHLDDAFHRAMLERLG